jgi:flagellar FliL protein
MAKTPAKTDETEGGEDGAAAPKGGKKKLIIAAVAALAIAGGGGYFLLGGKTKQAEHVEPKKVVAFVDVQEMMVNLVAEASQDRPRFLKLKVALEVGDAKTVPEIQPLLPRVQDLFQVFMREMRASDLEGSGGMYRLREELLRRVNIAVYPAKVDAVLFKEIVVQ